MNALKKVWLAVMKCTEHIIVFQLLIMCLVLFAQVVARYVFNRPLIWSEELSLFLMTWVTFMGISYGVSHRLHVRMTSLESKFPKAVRKALFLLVDLICLSACAVSMQPALSYFTKMASVYAPGFQISYGFVYLCIPVGFVLTIISIVVDMARVCKGDLPE